MRVETLSSRRRSVKRTGLIIIALVAAVGIGFVVVRKPAAASAVIAPATVSVATPLARQVTEWDSYIGRFEASQTVDVRPRVSGQITAVHFEDGEVVHKGQLLFTIDQRPFAAALAEAQAGRASARSDLALARTNLNRATRLVGAGAISKSDLDQLAARVQAGLAAVAGAEARVQSKSLDLNFTEVRAPLTGRVSDRRVDPGNLVAGGEGTNATLLTTVNALDPIYFAFDASEALFLKAKRARVAGQPTSPVEVRLQDEADYRWHGQLDFTDNGLDPRSGTIRMRAVFDNPKLFLTPGLFGNMRLSTRSKVSALLIPDAAIQSEQARKTVLTVLSDGTVMVKPVVLGALIDGLRIVRSGLTANDRVVIRGLQRAAPGALVHTKPGVIAPVETAPQPDAPPTRGEATFAL
ncbi:MAG: efflux RND transporter periplasmic adaptor subunit [Rhodanobacter sp.]